MGILTGLFKSRDKPTDRTAGSAYSFFLGGTASGKYVTERSAIAFWLLQRKLVAAATKSVYESR